MRQSIFFTRIFFLTLTISIISCLKAGVYKTQDIALQEAFFGADTVVRLTVFLNEKETAILQEKSRSQFSSRVISYYIGLKKDKPIGYAFFEDQVVRTKKTITMVVIAPSGIVKNVEVLAFYEPQDYLPIKKWFELFFGKSLTADLWPGRQIHAVTGATLSVRSFTQCTRRALALFELITATKS